MRKNRWLKSTCLLLVLCLLMTLLPFSAMAAEEKEEKQDVVDFVLLIDCSQTMTSNDPDDLVKKACELFVRLLPIEDARLSVIAFGYEGDAYTYTNFEVNKNRWYTDEAFVHVVSEMEGNLSVKRRDEISKAIANVGKNKGTLTPIGAALAAGVDTLLESGSEVGQACIVLMTDGDRTSGELGEDDRLTNESLGIAASHEWPIYAIELDYHGNNEASGSKARALLNKIVEESGAGAEGRKKVSNPDEVSKAFMDIVNTFWGGNGVIEDMILDPDGQKTRTIDVAPLTSELNISISGTSIREVRVQSQNAGVDRTFTKSEQVGEEGTMGNMIVTMDGYNTCIKLVCPKSGSWTITVKGDPNAEIDWYSGSQMEMNLDMTAAASKSGVLTKNDYINVSSCFNYHGVEIRDEVAYMDLPAKLVVRNLDTGKQATFPMIADKDGFSYQLKMSEAPGSGRLSLSVEIEHGMFRSGGVRSGSAEYELENLFISLLNPGKVIELKSYVNGDNVEGNSFPAVDLLNDVVVNPDGDPITFVMSCVSDRNNTFFNVQPDENGYLQFPSGMVPGVYEMELVMSEEGMTQDQYLVQKFTLTVEDREIETTPIPAPDTMLAKPVNFLFIRQDVSREYVNIELDGYFSDPDGVELTYGNVECDVPGLADATVENGVLKIRALEEGEVTVTFTVNDGISTITGQVSVEIEDGWAVYIRENWIYYAMILAAVVLAVLAFLFVRGSTRVKGKWNVQMSLRGDEICIEDAVALGGMPVAKKAKHKAFKLKDLLNNCSAYFTDPIAAGDWIVEYLKDDMVGDLKMKGVFAGNGFELLNIPASSDVKVQVGGKDVAPKTKKVRVSSGTVRIAVTVMDPNTGLPETLNIKISS